MSLQKAGGTNIDNTVTPAAAANLVDHLETHLVTAGWTIISGAGTNDVKFESATTADGMKVRIITGVSGSDMTLEIRNSGETASGATGNIRCAVDGVNSWRFMANRYGFVLHETTSAVALGNSSGAKKWCMAGTLYLESFLTPTVTEVGYLMGDHRSTTNASHYESLRTKPMIEGTPANNSLLYNGSILDSNNTTSANIEEGDLGLLIPVFPLADSTGYSGSPTKTYKWASGENILADPLLAWGSPDRTTNMKLIRGQIFDVIVALDNDLSQGDTVTIGLDDFRVVSDGAGADSTRHPYALLFLMP